MTSFRCKMDFIRFHQNKGKKCRRGSEVCNPLKGVVALLSPTHPLMVKFHLFFTAFTISPNDHFKMIL